MSNGIAVLIYEKNNKLKGLCTGISSHDELCKLDEELKYGKIEPYRFELLYPNNLIYDRGYNKPLRNGIVKEQPDQKIWNVAFKVSNPYRMKHTIKQLQYAYFVNANLIDVNLSNADLSRSNFTGANLTEANLTGANLSETILLRVNFTKANLTGTNFSEANLTGSNFTNANLTCANFWGSTILRSNFTGANLTGTNLSEAQCYEM